MTGAFFAAPLAGPIEFSTGEIVLLLVILVALVLALPVLAGIIGVVLYRRRTAVAGWTPRDAVLQFVKWAAIIFVVQFAVAWAIQGLSRLT